MSENKWGNFSFISNSLSHVSSSIWELLHNTLTKGTLLFLNNFSSRSKILTGLVFMVKSSLIFEGTYGNTLEGSILAFRNNDTCRTRHRGGRLKIISLWKRTNFWHPVLWWRTVLFKESPPSIMVTRNPNWSTEILWYGTGYVKGKILSPLKCSAWGRLHCWFCLKLLNIYPLMLWWFVYNIPDSGASEYSSSNNSNSGVGKNS